MAVEIEVWLHKTKEGAEHGIPTDATTIGSASCVTEFLEMTFWSSLYDPKHFPPNFSFHSGGEGISLHQALAYLKDTD